MIITTYLTALDLRYYAQTIGCAIGDLGYKTANDFYYGKKCAAANLRRLKLASGYLRIIERYESQVIDGNKASVTFTAPDTLEGTNQIEITAPGLDVTLPFTTSVAITIALLVGIINSGTSGYTATGTDTTITIYLPSSGIIGNNITITLEMLDESGNPLSFNSVLSSGGTDTYILTDNNNCLTEEQIQGIILPAVQIVTGVALPPPGIIVTTNPIPVTLGNTRITETSDMRVTESGDPRIVE